MPGGVAQATAFINSGQDATIKAETDAKEGAPTRTVADKYTDAYSSLADIFMKDGAKPEAVSMADTYTKLRKDMNLDDLEGAVNDLQSQQDLLTEQQRIRSAAERDKPVAMNVIEGRIGEEERQTMERMNSIVLQKESAVRQLQSANATIENMMQFTKMDYDTARNSYNDQFSQQMQLFGMTKNLVDSADKDEQEKKDAQKRAHDMLEAVKRAKVKAKSKYVLSRVDPFDTLKAVLSSCGGWFAHQSGVFRVWPGKYYAPVQGATLTPADFVGPVNLIERRSAAERFGGVEGTFWSEEDGWREVSYPTVTLADAGDSPRLVSLPQPMTPSPYQAQRVAHMTLLRNGYGLRLDGVTNLKGLLIGAGDIPQLGFPDDGVSESAFWVTDWRLTEGEDGLLSVALSADQHTPAMYLPPVLQVYTPSQKPNMMRAGAGYPDPVTGLEAEWQFQEA